MVARPKGRFYSLSEGQRGMGVMPEGNVDDVGLLGGEVTPGSPSSSDTTSGAFHAT